MSRPEEEALPVPLWQLGDRLACDCNVLPIVIDSESKPLDIGQSTRNIPSHIRRLVTNRDRGCSFPGRARPPTQRQIHHIIEWQHGGDTADHNLAMLRNRHHHIIHHSHWEVRMVNNHPEFLPPSYLDPNRSPLTNPVHGPRADQGYRVGNRKRYFAATSRNRSG